MVLSRFRESVLYEDYSVSSCALEWRGRRSAPKAPQIGRRSAPGRRRPSCSPDAALSAPNRCIHSPPGPIKRWFNQTLWRKKYIEALTEWSVWVNEGFLWKDKKKKRRNGIKFFRPRLQWIEIFDIPFTSCEQFFPYSSIFNKCLFNNIIIILP